MMKRFAALAIMLTVFQGTEAAAAPCLEVTLTGT